MSYAKAEEFLPNEVIELIQQYVDGRNIYIPRKEARRTKWGTGTTIREELDSRNKKIYSDFLKGLRQEELAAKYFLSIKSIQRIIRKEKIG